MTWSRASAGTSTVRRLKSPRAVVPTTMVLMHPESFTTYAAFSITASICKRWRWQLLEAPTCAAITPGACSTTSNGRKGSASALAWPMWISKRSNARSKIQDAGTPRWLPRIACLQSFLLHDQFTVLHSHITDIIRKLQLVMLFGQLLLQRRIHQRNRHVHVSHFEFGRL